MTQLRTKLGAFVLDFSDAFWQIPIKREEQKFFCATALSTKDRGKKWKRNQKKQRIRKFIAFQRAAQ